MAKTYNGHKNYNYWNVALWIANDFGLYTMAKESVNRFSNRNDAARYFLDFLHSVECTHTPDGVKYNYSNVRAAISDL